jgi:hypothetical protein
VDRLGLPSLPLVPSLRAGSDDCEGAPDEDEAAPVLPRATPLLYGFSERVVDRPGYWPRSVCVTGAWHAPPGWEGSGGAAAFSPPQALSMFLEAPGAVAAVTFGSMASLEGAIPFPRALLRTIAVRRCSGCAALCAARGCRR